MASQNTRPATLISVGITSANLSNDDGPLYEDRLFDFNFGLEQWIFVSDIMVAALGAEVTRVGSEGPDGANKNSVKMRNLNLQLGMKIVGGGTLLETGVSYSLNLSIKEVINGVENNPAVLNYNDSGLDFFIGVGLANIGLRYNRSINHLLDGYTSDYWTLRYSLAIF